MKEEETKKEEAAGFLMGLLTGWGLPQTWAKVITGAVIGALAALGVMSQSSCSSMPRITPEQASSAWRAGSEIMKIFVDKEGK